MIDIVDDRLEDQVAAECATLEEIAAMLGGSGPPRMKVDRVLALVRERLRHLRSGPGANTGHEDSGEADRWWRAPHGETEGMHTAMETNLHAGLVGESAAMKLVGEAIHRVSHSQATVLLRGESGTGKELVAKAIHLQGPRAEQPFIPLHCASVSETLFESELFGHERGAFTGAVETRKGRFELAEGGTLFLDEIGDIPLGTQVKLLRVLQEKTFERVGGTRPLPVDVRVISATHRDLEAMVRAGAFREDLYYRLNVVPIMLPPLREREGDASLLIDHFLTRVNRVNRRAVRLGRDVRALMARYHWPGNVRELQNCVERLVVMARHDGDVVTGDNVPASLRGYFADMKQVTEGHAGAAQKGQGTHGGTQALGESLQEIERARLLDALQRTGWIQARTARALGMTPRQVAYKMRKYGIGEVEEH